MATTIAPAVDPATGGDGSSMTPAEEMHQSSTPPPGTATHDGQLSSSKKSMFVPGYPGNTLLSLRQLTVMRCAVPGVGVEDWCISSAGITDNPYPPVAASSAGALVVATKGLRGCRDRRCSLLHIFRRAAARLQVIGGDPSAGEYFAYRHYYDCWVVVGATRAGKRRTHVLYLSPTSQCEELR